MKRLILFFLLVQVISPYLSAEPASGSGKWVFGIYTGWSSIFGRDIDWHPGIGISDKTTLKGHLGIYTRYELSDMFGVQLDANYQAGLFRPVPIPIRHWDWPEELGEDRFGIFSFSLQGALHFMQIQRLRVYGIGGGGISSSYSGIYGGFSDLYYHLVAGLGIKFSLSSTHVRPALSLGGTFHHLMEPRSGSTQTADYVRFCLGLEF